MSLRKMWMLLWAINAHTDTSFKITVHLNPSCWPFTCTSLFQHFTFPLSLDELSPFFASPLVRLTDDSTGREWQCINYLAVSLILIWLSESSGSVQGRLGHLPIWPGSKTYWKDSRGEQKSSTSITRLLTCAPCVSRACDLFEFSWSKNHQAWVEIFNGLYGC